MSRSEPLAQASFAVVLRRAILLLFGGMLLAACDGQDSATTDAVATQERLAPSSAAIAAESARLDQWFAERWEEALSFSPMQRTTLGQKVDYDQIDDLSEAGADRRIAWRQSTVEDLRAQFDYALLTPEAKTSYDIWVSQEEREQAGLPFRRRHYVFTQLRGPQSGLPNFLISFHKVDEESDMQAYVARIGGISRAIGQLLERAQAEAIEGVRPPEFAYEIVLKEARAQETGAPFAGDGDAPLWADAKAKVDALVEDGKIDAVRGEELKAAARKALVEEFKPAYDALIAWFEQDRPNADEIATGVGKLPQGDAFYAYMLSVATTTGMTPDEVHGLGLEEVARIRGEMEAIKDQVGFEGSLQDFFRFIREDGQFYFPDTDEGREAYLDAARADLDAIETKLPDYFGILPRADLVVKRVEPFREQAGAAQHYYPGTPDGSRPGVFYVHLVDMTAMPKPQLEVAAYHEGIPGHHLQISIAQELTGLPIFRTRAVYAAYLEGWALYAELLAREMGAYRDPYSDFGRLTLEIWRAVRLVVDTGLHAEGWTEEQAVRYFQENVAITDQQIRSEVERYIVSPGIASSYKIGMLKILELRTRAEAELGDGFDIRDFHDTVLGGGALPLDILERRVDQWIAEH